MSYYKDPTAGAAIGSVDKEFGRMRKRAIRIRDDFDSGKMSPEAFETACREFDGYYFGVLVSVMSEEPKCGSFDVASQATEKHHGHDKL